MNVSIALVYVACYIPLDVDLPLIFFAVGFDTANKVYTCVGSPDVKTAYTSKADIGRSLAQLSLAALSPDLAANVPDNVRIFGSLLSYNEVRDTVQRVRNDLCIEPQAEIVIKIDDVELFKRQVKDRRMKEPAVDPSGHLRVLMAEGKLDFTTDNDNELVNPDQKFWKWKTVEDYVREVGGRPWC
ncbi:hypothetical protein AcW1_002289 [Taiwanofungus camphoratus]|nr:hypothetical protein AcW1_002289 [Antrodia cinnamomea]